MSKVFIILGECNFCQVGAKNKGFMPSNERLTHQSRTKNANVVKALDLNFLLLTL